MADARLDRAARLIADQRLKPRPTVRLPPELAPADQAEAYAIQARLRRLLGEAGSGAHVGWKIGSTTAAMRKLLGVPAPAAGAILAKGVLENPAALAHSGFRRVGVECEVAIRLARDLVPTSRPIDRSDVETAVDVLYPAIEIVDDRYGDFQAVGTNTMIADDFFHAAIVLGPAVSAWRGLELAAAAGVTRVNGLEVQRGRGADVLGHPFNSLAWLANRLAEIGERLTAGQVVMTGSLTLPHWAAAGDKVVIAIDGLGEASIAFI
ncbi:MAG: fumarylacetoacetate hydrolase family protein [Proteobacteria bacterium]|nr:fumarylacetoacetate hydrolase family protein [Pseudomonadota bacterium]MBI3500089.1 fumarylacetoacetate hydrolase family protein [Pseudomonadota bacterium]